MNNVTFERWLPVPRWEGYYEVSNLGRVRSVPHETEMGLRGGHVLAGGTYRSGHKHVTFTRTTDAGKDRETFQIHRLVMLAFTGPCPEGQMVRHLNGIPDDNRWAPGGNEAEIIAAGGNLIYGTAKENAEDRDQRHGRNYRSNLTHCPQDHPYDEANTYYAPSGSRQCRTCRDGGRPAPECREEGCSESAKSRKRCATHYAQWRRANMTEEQREKVRAKDAKAGREKRKRLREGPDNEENMLPLSA